MKKYILLFTTIVLASYGFAQTIERSVFAASGNYTKTSTLSLSSTLGEVFAATLNSSSTVLTQGFQQPTIAGGVGVSELENNSFLVYPNPFHNVINIKSTFKGNYTLKVVDVLGRNLYVDFSNNNLISNLNVELNMSDYESGMYFLKLYDDSNHLKTIKIQKQ